MKPEDIINGLLDRAASGQISPEELQALKEYSLDPRYMDLVAAGAKERELDQLGSGPLRPIIQYYVPKAGTFQLRWPLGLPMPLPVSFDTLDRQTQFFVLFGEWSRRELEAMQLLNTGNLAGAESTFEECLARAQQIEVAELVARSCEGLMRVAQRRGEPAIARAFSQRAMAARGRG